MHVRAHRFTGQPVASGEVSVSGHTASSGAGLQAAAPGVAVRPHARRIPLARLLARAGLVLGAGWLAACSTVSTPPAGQASATAAPVANVRPGTSAASQTAGARATTATSRGQPAIVAESDAVRELDAASLTPGDDSAEVVVSNDLWDRIRAGFALPELDSPLVARHEKYYLSRPDYLQRMLGRGSRYLHHIVEEVERRGMPTELALLPFVESAMNPTAMSSAQAAGLWQFIPSTGKQYDLKQNWWVDNRRDVVASTRAALDYLQSIYQMHGDDWFLALASYNWGEGSVLRAVRANQKAGRPADYAHLRMPAETRNYVPKLLAIKHIVLNAQRLGLALPALPDEPYFVTVEKTRPIDLKLAARFAGMTEAEFLALNPAHNRPVISATRTKTLKIPVDRIEQFRTAMAEHAAQGRPFVTWHPYTIQRNESLASVASRAGLTVSELLKANGIAPGVHLLAGTRLLVPQHRVKDETLVEQFNGPRLYQQVDAGPLVHRVRRGDTGASIARRYGLTLAELRSMNRRIAPLRPGQTLVVRRNQRQTVLVAEDGSRQIISRQAALTASRAAVPATPHVTTATAGSRTASAAATTSTVTRTTRSGIRLVTYEDTATRSTAAARSASRSVARQTPTRSVSGMTRHTLRSGTTVASTTSGTTGVTRSTAAGAASRSAAARAPRTARGSSARLATTTSKTPRRVAATRATPSRKAAGTRVAASGTSVKATTPRSTRATRRTPRATRNSLRQAGKVASAR